MAEEIPPEEESKLKKLFPTFFKAGAGAKKAAAKAKEIATMPVGEAAGIVKEKTVSGAKAVGGKALEIGQMPVSEAAKKVAVPVAGAAIAVGGAVAATTSKVAGKTWDIVKGGLHFGYSNFGLASFAVLLATTWHLFDVFTGYSWSFRTYCYLLSLILGLFVFEGYLTTIGIGVLAWGGPIALLNYTKGTSLEYAASIFVVCVPVWLVAFFFPKSPPTEGISLFKILKFFYILFVLVMVLRYLIIPGMAAAGITKEVVGSVIPTKDLPNITQTALKNVKNSPKALTDLWNRQIAIATGGDYYSGTVEQNKREPIGVYIENMRQADPTLYADQPIYIWANLKAKTILEKPINVTSACYASDQYKGTVKGKVNGLEKAEFKNLLGEEDIEAECEFDAGRLSKGQHQVNMTALFNFDTFSYQKAYLMDRLRVLDLKRQGVNPLDLYKITDKNPKTVFTQGPVKIGMGLPDMPIGITMSEETVLPTLGVTIENLWEGRIKKINRLLLYVPEGMTVQNCDHRIAEAKDLKADEVQQGYTAFQLDKNDPLATEIANQPTGTYRTFKCRIKTIKDPAQIIGTAPIATKSFKVTVSYDYELVKPISINVEAGVGKGYAYVAPKAGVPSAPSKEDINIYKAKFETTEFQTVSGAKQKYADLLKASTTDISIREMLAAIIVVETGVENAPKTSPDKIDGGCAGITNTCGPLAAQIHLCDSSLCSGYDYRMQVDREMNAVAQNLVTLRNSFTTPLNYNDKEKFAIASYAAGHPYLIKRAIEITSGQRTDKAQTELTWEDVKPNINLEILNSWTAYDSFTEAQKIQKAEEIKSRTDTIVNYKNEFKGQFS